MSLIQMQRSPDRFAAWLAVLAILLLFIAPVISKSLASAAGQHVMMPGMEAMSSCEHAMSSSEHTQTAPQHAMSSSEHAQTAPQHSMPMMDDSACGYCVLLAHLPLDLSSLPALWSVLQAARLADLPLFCLVTARFIPAFFHPRAPPLY